MLFFCTKTVKNVAKINTKRFATNVSRAQTSNVLLHEQFAHSLRELFFNVFSVHNVRPFPRWWQAAVSHLDQQIQGYTKGTQLGQSETYYRPIVSLCYCLLPRAFNYQRSNNRQFIILVHQSALMKDQISIHTVYAPKANDHLIKSGAYQLLYISPEQWTVARYSS